MQLSVLQRIDIGARRLVPFGMTLVLMLFAMTPTYIPGLSHITPMYGLMAVFFWSIYRPDLLGYGTVFAIGILEDLLTGAPLGSGALILLLCQRTVLSQQKFFNAKPFGIFWLAFALLARRAALALDLRGPRGASGFTPFGSMFTSASDDRGAVSCGGLVPGQSADEAPGAAMIMTRDSDWTKMFNRRAAILGGAQAAMVATLVGRMYYLQVLQADRYRTLADENRINIQLLPPPRGRILDRFGQPLAANKQQFQVMVIPEQAPKIADTLDARAAHRAAGLRARSHPQGS